MISSSLLAAIRTQYRLAWRGTHGAIHWARVLENGLRLAELTGGNEEVVKLFAVFHDACRLNEHTDKHHGRRGADLAARLRGKSFVLGDADFQLLCDACSRHTEPRYLCTAAAKDNEVIEWAHDRADRGIIPAFAIELWGVEKPHLKPHQP
jgi:uncharacterized protein